MKKIHHIAAVVIILIVVPSCYKQLPIPGSTPGKQYYLIPQTLKDYASFKPGTYWIYQDSLTGKIDSQYVTQYQNGIDTELVAADVHRYCEWFVVSINTTFDTSSYMYFITMTESLNGISTIGNEDKDYYNRTHMGLYQSETVYLVYPFTDYSNRYGEDTNTINNIFNYSNYIVNGRGYSNVVEVHDSENPTCGYQPETHYIGNHVGIIKRKFLKTNNTWNLIRYHIVQ